jgi:hypothetical protein
MSSTFWRRIIAIGIVALLLAALPAAAVQGQGKAGTTLKAYKEADGFWEVTYDWTVTKTASPDAVLLSTGSSQGVTFTITATRTKVSERIGVRGQICVTNGGDRATEGLKIVDVVQQKKGAGDFEELTKASVDVSANPVLDPGEKGCYPYEITFTPVPGAIYRNEAKVTITNHSGHLNEEFGPEPKAGFSLPGSPTEFDETATLSDMLGSCPAGFTCTKVGDWGDWSLTDSDTKTLTLTITNNSACDTESSLQNTATLTEGDSGQVRTSSATVTVRAPACQVLEQCTYTQGYWKNHAAWPGGYHPGDTFYNSGKNWMTVLWTPPAKGNAYYILAHQYIAAKLNVANGAVPPDEVAQALNEAHNWFTAPGRTDAAPTGSDRTTALYLAGILAAFNEGTTGPGHCGSTATTS